MAAKPRFEPAVERHVTSLYGENRREHAFDATDAASFAAWQAEARPALHALLGLTRMHDELASHEPAMTLGKVDDLGDITRQVGTLSTEPTVALPVALVRPKGEGPFPLAVTPHGHGEFGRYAGIARDADDERLIEDEQRDVALQAARRGYLAIAPATRGIGFGVPDIDDRFGGRHCWAHAAQSLLAGRCAMGERVWDVMRLIDWAENQPDIDTSRVLVLGNSGGGQVTTYSAAADPRITIAVPSCSFAPLINARGTMSLCPCNLVPGMLAFGEYWDVAALIAPRPLCVVHGRRDELFAPEDIDRAVDRLRAAYAVAGTPNAFEHRWGDGGHRFYADLMWSFIEQVASPGGPASA